MFNRRPIFSEMPQMSERRLPLWYNPIAKNVFPLLRQKTSLQQTHSVMKITLSLLFAPFAVLLFVSCGDGFSKKIAALEQQLAETDDPNVAATLFETYQEAVKAHPGKHADNLRYLTKAAELKFLREKDAVTAVRLVNDGIKTHGAGQDLAEPMSVLARVWRLYQHKAAPDMSKNPDDIDLTRYNLERNTHWLDSCLVRLDRDMGGATVADRSKAEKFLQVAEGYATLIQTADPNKFASLNMMAAGLARTIGEPNTALRFYYHVAEKMPTHRDAQVALLMMGIIYEDELQDLDKAKSTYEEFLRRYPDGSEYTNDVKTSLENLGIPLEERVKRMEQNQE